MPTFSTYDQVGLKEDVSDIIMDISPTDTPLFSAIKSQKVDNRVYQYQTDSLDTPAANAVEQTRQWQH